MESGGRVEAAGPSTSASSSSFCCSSSSSLVGEKQEPRQGEMITEKISEKVRSDEVIEEEEEEDDGLVSGFVPGPLVPLKEQLEKDKDDESLRRWKEKLLGCIEGDLNGIISEDCGELNTPLPVDEKQKGKVLFTLREGSKYQLKLAFTVKHNIVSGLAYCNTVWKGGVQVDQMRGMLGTFAPQREPYVHCLDEETTPSGVLARGVYLAKLKFEDDDKRCHLELNYSFEIKKRS